MSVSVLPAANIKLQEVSVSVLPAANIKLQGISCEQLQISSYSGRTSFTIRT